MKKLNKYINLAQYFTAIWNGKDGYEVKDKDIRYTVDIGVKTCSCRYWQLSSIHCHHSVTAIYLSSLPLEDYIVDCYSVVDYNKIYDYCMLPMEGMGQWPTDPRQPQPPAYVKMPWRPREERREPGESKKATKVSRVGSVITCSKCKKTGHNSRTCCPKSKAKRTIMEKGKEVSNFISLVPFMYAFIVHSSYFGWL